MFYSQLIIISRTGSLDKDTAWLVCAWPGHYQELLSARTCYQVVRTYWISWHHICYYIEQNENVIAISLSFDYKNSNDHQQSFPNTGQISQQNPWSPLTNKRKNTSLMFNDSDHLIYLTKFVFHFNKENRGNSTTILRWRGDFATEVINIDAAQACF